MPTPLGIPRPVSRPKAVFGKAAGRGRGRAEGEIAVHRQGRARIVLIAEVDRDAAGRVGELGVLEGDIARAVECGIAGVLKGSGIFGGAVVAEVGEGAGGVR